MKCRICGEEVTLSPSAAKRAASPSNRFTGMSAADYTKLFPTHTHCQLARNKELTADCIKRHQIKPGSVI